MQLPEEIRSLFAKHGLTVRPMQGYCRLQGGNTQVEFRMTPAGLFARVGGTGPWGGVPNLECLAGVANANLSV